MGSSHTQKLSYLHKNNICSVQLSYEEESILPGIMEGLVMVFSRPRFPRSLLPLLRTVHQVLAGSVRLGWAGLLHCFKHTHALFRPRTAAGYFDPNTMLLLSPLPRPCLICRLSGGQFQASASELGLWQIAGRSAPLATA